MGSSEPMAKGAGEDSHPQQLSPHAHMQPRQTSWQDHNGSDPQARPRGALDLRGLGPAQCPVGGVWVCLPTQETPLDRPGFPFPFSSAVGHLQWGAATQMGPGDSTGNESINPLSTWGTALAGGVWAMFAGPSTSAD